MDKRSKTYLAIFILLLMAVIYIESVKPRPINWYPSYVMTHKIPYGTYIFRQELAHLFSDSSITEIKIPPYIFLSDSTKIGTYIFVNDGINFGEAEMNRILDFVDRGNTVFMSTHGGNIDSLDLQTQAISSTAFEHKAFVKMLNKNLSRQEFDFDRPFFNTVFSKIDSSKVIALGKTGYINKEGERVSEGINFIKMPFGKGDFYLHTFPEAFTNYFILKSPNQDYTASLISYLDPKLPIYLDTYYKTGKKTLGSPMHFLLSSRSLKWAYYFVLLAVIMFVIFEGKRKQGPIPIIKPLTNKTLAFTRTIANMYFEKSEHKNIAELRISYFLEYIRTKLHMATVTIDQAFYKQLAARSSNSEESVIKLFDYIEQVHQKNTISKEELIKLNAMIEAFKK